MKTISKSFIESKAKIPQIYTELEVLKKVKSPFVVTCHYAFTSRANLHILLDFCPGGELFFHMHNLGRFTER
jgi:protein-serine/threonine kinase